MSLQSTIWLDGKPTSTLPLPDRGVDFGDGLFETLLVRAGQPLFTQLHFERLAHGLRVLHLPDCLTEVKEHVAQVTRALREEDWRWTVLRISVIRGPGPRGYAPSSISSPRILMRVEKLERDCDQLATPAHLGLAELRLATQPMLAGIKHLNRLEQVMAAHQAAAEGVDECIVLDQDKHIVSVIAGNLFVVHENELLTPKLVNRGVLGTRRRLIMERWAPSMGLKVRETELTLANFESADEVFYSNSLLTVRPVATLRDFSWENHRVCEKLFQRYLEELA